MRVAAVLSLALICPAAFAGATVPSPEVGIVLGGSDAALVFGTDPPVVLGAVPLSILRQFYDCAISPDGRRGFVSDFQHHIWIFDLDSGPPHLALGSNPIPMTNHGEDMVLTADGRFLVVCDGGLPDPISVIDTANRLEVSTFALGTSCNSVDVCGNGDVLVSSTTGVVRRLVLDTTGHLHDTGQSLPVTDASNVYCSPDSTAGVAVTFDGHMRSFHVAGLAPVSLRAMSAYGGSGVMARDGTRFYGRSFNGIEAFDFDQATAELGAAPAFIASVGSYGLFNFYGADQLALDLPGAKLYSPEQHRLDVVDAVTGVVLPPLLIPDLAYSGSICLGPFTQGPCTVAGCDDGNPCTDDGCDDQGSCIHVPDDSNSCGGPASCIETHVCSGGACVSGGPADCNGPCPPGFQYDGYSCTKTYDIDAGLLDNLSAFCDGTGVNRYACDGAPYGFHWTDVSGNGVGVVESVHIRLVTGRRCAIGPSGLSFNGVPLDALDWPVDCTCTPGHTTQELYLPLDSGYVKDGANTMALAPSGGCEGMSSSLTLGGLFAQVDVSYRAIDPNCSTGTCNAGSGRCEYQIQDCDDGDPCTDDTCDATGGCIHVPVPEYTPCDDGNDCNGNEYCHEDGGCYADYPLICFDDGNPCTDDRCDPVVGCVYEERSCDDQNVCTADSCDPESGECIHVESNGPCDDGNPCTVADACGGGTCHGGAPVACVPLDPCHDAGACDPGSGLCSNPPAADGTECDDGNACTTGETCEGGACTPPGGGSTEPDPRTNGYYKRLCHGPHSGDALTDADALCVASVAQAFAGLTTAAEICAEIEPSHPNGDACDRADDDLMVLALNLCRGRVCVALSIDSQCGGSATVAASLAQSDAILSSPARDAASCARAKCLCEEINDGLALELDTLTLELEAGAVRLSWSPPYLNDGTSGPSAYHVWRRVRGSTAAFARIAETIDPTYLDESSAGESFEYEVTAIVN